MGQELELRNPDSTLHFEISAIQDFVRVLQLTQQKHFMSRKCFLVISITRGKRCRK